MFPFHHLLNADHPPFDVQYRKLWKGGHLQVFIDQQDGTGINGRRVKGVQLDYYAESSSEAEGGADGHYTISLAPKANIDGLIVAVEGEGLKGAHLPCDLVVTSRQSQLRQHGEEEVRERPDLEGREKETYLSCQSSMVKVWFMQEDSVNPLTASRAKLDKLRQAGFLTEKTLHAIETALSAISTHDPEKNFNSSQLKKSLTEQLGDGRGGKPISGHRATSSAKR